ncbi:ParB/RepB/Spo0J family partition protein [Desulfococcaceae bacterium OttesenSCG-928-F15]|nr:ParB/RepB/Spo0J family partition protein [Desulfococcaceae bacterium OttesenSCG-928-F15]
MTESERKKRKKVGLGRGLSALIPDIEASDKAADVPVTSEEVPIDVLLPNPFQPRKHFDLKALEELSASIRMEGVLQPVLVRRQGARYEIIAGERRVRAARMAELETVPVILRDLDDRRMLQVAIVENIQRDDLGPLEEARAYQRLVSEFHMTQEEVGECVGKSRSTITNFIRLLQLPDEVQNAMDQGLLSMGHGRALLAVQDRDLLLELLEQVLVKKLSVRECEDLVRRALDAGKKSSAKALPLPEEYRKEARRLGLLLGLPVHIRGDRNKGKLEIRYASTQDLKNILEKLDHL